MAFGRQRELMKAQEAILKQQAKRLSQARARSRAADMAAEAAQQEKQEDSNNGEISLLPEAAVEPEETPLEDDLKRGTIFVSVASYRDPECPKTIADCFDKATYPRRIFVGCCQQNEPEDVDCMDSPTAQKFQSNIRVMRVDADEAKGPVYARALIEQNLFGDQAYYLVIDSHTLFTPGWDVEIIKQLVMCDSDKPVLTCYPPDYDLATRQLPIEQPATFLKFRDYHPRLKFTQQDPVRYKHPPPRPQPSLFWAAGFSFTLGSVVREVPYDPHLQYVFLGEEISMAVRLYTHGYDTFAPMTNVVFHYTSRTYRPVFWERFYKKDGKSKVSHEVRQQRKEIETQSNHRIRQLLAGLDIEAPYGLGQVRTLTQFQEWSGLDFMSRTAAYHTKLGLSPNAGEEERFCKYGIQTFQ